MRSLVIYDSTYGNTEKIAKAIGKSLSSPVKTLEGLSYENLGNLELVVVGSPTQGGQPTKPLQEFLNQIPDGLLKNKKAAAFDTRFAKESQGFGLKLLMSIIGFAAPKIAKTLEKKGAKFVTQEGFLVTDTKGPLVANEIERAEAWAKSLK